ncbi:MAG: glycosyltransferase family 9 protein, partial [bacterium]|nr:glycosyltransferase family 9 protein [bacterium]
VINLEKVAGLCALADSINAWRRYGFRFDPDSGTAMAYDGSQHVIEMCTNPNDKRSSKKYWEHILFEMVGSEWQGEGPILGYTPKEKEEKFDIGYNFNVGNKWPLEAWPMELWKALEKRLSGKRTISWQEGQHSIEDYIDWINSVDLLVTNDSLGLHIAHALGKKIIALFGPTISTEIFIKDGVKLLPEGEYDCLPCLSSVCLTGRNCMYDISVDTVYDNIEKLFNKKD